MKVFAAPILFLCLLSVEAFAQSTTFQQVGPLAYERFNNPVAGASFRLGVAAHYDPIAVNAPGSQAAVHLIGQVGTPNTLPRLWPHFSSYGTLADSVASAPFSYRSFDQGTQRSDEIREAFQIASSIGFLGFDGPAFNRIQNMVVHIARHYGSQEAVRVNRDCVRSLSCSSLYEKSVIQRIPLRPPK